MAQHNPGGGSDSHPRVCRSCTMKQATRHYCRNLHCRSKLPAPVENEHRAFCTAGCHANFYHTRCLVCEDKMRRKRADQRFGSGHKVCKNEYQRFPHVYDYPGANLGNDPRECTSALETLDSSGLESAIATADPVEMFWRDKSGQGWHWEADQGEHRLFNRTGDVVARLNERGGKWVLTWPRCFAVKQADTEEAGQRLALSVVLAALPPDPVIAARLARAKSHG